MVGQDLQSSILTSPTDLKEQSRMKCVFCAEEIPEQASVCGRCGNDLQIPQDLIVENNELKKQVAILEQELEKLQTAQRLQRQKSKT